eukprot:scaffold74134_cov29-Tisochrysis_lutea.AAC.1
MSAAQFLPHSSAATHFLSAVRVQMEFWKGSRCTGRGVFRVVGESRGSPRVPTRTSKFGLL